jgi:hypothetical protein
VGTETGKYSEHWCLEATGFMLNRLLVQVHTACSRGWEHLGAQFFGYGQNQQDSCRNVFANNQKKQDNMEKFLRNQPVELVCRKNGYLRFLQIK